MNRRTWAAVLAVFGTFLAVPAANAATVHVDDDGADCPSATQSSVQDAVDAADPGDTVAICPGTYVEGTGSPGTNALTINKSLTIRGAGSEKVKIQPRRSTPSGGQIAAGSPALRDTVGNIILIQGGTASPVTVDISGVTVDGNGVYVEGGVLYLDAQGSLVRDHVTNTVDLGRQQRLQQPGRLPRLQLRLRRRPGDPGHIGSSGGHHAHPYARPHPRRQVQQGRRCGSTAPPPTPRR